jgi:hypothetical protein
MTFIKQIFCEGTSRAVSITRIACVLHFPFLYPILLAFRYSVPPPKTVVRAAASELALQCLADLKDIQIVCIPPLTAAAAAVHPTLSPIVAGLHDALQIMHQMFMKLYASIRVQTVCDLAFTSF